MAHPAIHCLPVGPPARRIAGLELIPPGVVLVSEWRRTDSGPLPPANEVNAYCGVARKR